MPSEGRFRRAEPPVTETTQPFWDATKQHRYLVQSCTTCGNVIAYPREVCPFCAGTALEWRPSAGTGTLYAFTVEHKLANPLEEGSGPYAVGLIDLDEGSRVMSNIVNCPFEALAVGMALQVVWEPLSDGRNLPLFEPRKARQ
jgi:uncharacterized OB-fold protein